uniref:Uncharacterized protein n=1 Tax=Romanomermis culicivorax TaxID=13658 RepID=A0A915K2B4_ROMCU
PSAAVGENPHQNCVAVQPNVGHERHHPSTTNAIKKTKSSPGLDIREDIFCRCHKFPPENGNWKFSASTMMATMEKRNSRRKFLMSIVARRANLVEIYEKESDDMAKRLELISKKFADERNKFQEAIQKLKEEASGMQAQLIERLKKLREED